MKELTEKDFINAIGVLAHGAGELALKAIGADSCESDTNYGNALEGNANTLLENSLDGWILDVMRLNGEGRGHTYTAIVDVSTYASEMGVLFRVTVLRDDGLAFDSEKMMWRDLHYCASFVIPAASLMLTDVVNSTPEGLTQENALHIMGVADILSEIYAAADSEFLGELEFHCDAGMTSAGWLVLNLVITHPDYDDICCVAAGANGVVLIGRTDEEAEVMWNLHQVTCAEDVLNYLAVVFPDKKAC